MVYVSRKLADVANGTYRLKVVNTENACTAGGYIYMYFLLAVVV